MNCNDLINTDISVEWLNAHLRKNLASLIHLDYYKPNYNKHELLALVRLLSERNMYNEAKKILKFIELVILNDNDIYFNVLLQAMTETVKYSEIVYFYEYNIIKQI